MHVIEAWITVTLADGTTRCEPWRLVTSLLDHERYPARELVERYHRRWQVETTYFSIKATMLDGGSCAHAAARAWTRRPTRSWRPTRRSSVPRPTR
ncbi:transposase [Actinacidiphila sp. bgisy167]|uniref:transposase n=1 Tax=Actinacidiphila sp. bgisy167 TaxID=3413797 RepID=UPI003D7388C6